MKQTEQINQVQENQVTFIEEEAINTSYEMENLSSEENKEEVVPNSQIDSIENFENKDFSKSDYQNKESSDNLVIRQTKVNYKLTKYFFLGSRMADSVCT